MFTGTYAADFDTWSEFYDSSPEMALLKDGAVTGANVLEVGVGTGRIASRLTPVAGQYIGVDVDERLLTYCRDRMAWPDGTMFLRQDGQHLGIEASTVDVLIDGWTFSSFDEPAQAARGYRRVLRPTGTLRVVREETTSEYERILQRFVPEQEAYDPEQCIDAPLKAVFGSPERKQVVSSAYVFPSADAAYEAFRFHLEAWKNLDLTAVQHRELRGLLDADDDGRVRIGEQAVFLEFIKK